VGFFLWNGARRADGGDDQRVVYGDDGSGDGYSDTSTLDVFGDDNADTTNRADVRRG
jgi:hypothetical protein